MSATQNPSCKQLGKCVRCAHPHKRQPDVVVVAAVAMFVVIVVIVVVKKINNLVKIHMMAKIKTLVQYSNARSVPVADAFAAV